MKLDSQQLARVAALFRAFAEPTRLAILQELKADELAVSEIVDRLTTSQANVSKQLKLLHDAGVVSRRKSGTTVFYTIADPMVFELCRLVCDKLNRDAVKPSKTPISIRQISIQSFMPSWRYLPRLLWKDGLRQ
jgi:DNA-binding transcriptional ArsR family regulator